MYGAPTPAPRHYPPGARCRPSLTHSASACPSSQPPPTARGGPPVMSTVMMASEVTPKKRPAQDMAEMSLVLVLTRTQLSLPGLAKASVPPSS
jgi:hypothetical protein